MAGHPAPVSVRRHLRNDTGPGHVAEIGGSPEMKAHFVIFFSPGTFFAEQSRKSIDSWDIEKALKMVKGITERYNATPYGFCFTTRTRGENDLDSRETKRSKMYFLGGTVLTLEDIKARNDPNDQILVSNMEGNGYKRVVQNCNSWKWTRPFHDGDIVLPYSLASASG